MSDVPQLELYKFSGALGKSPLFLLLLAVPLCVLWSAAYAYLDVYLPIGGVLTVFMVIGYAFLVVMSVSLLGKLGKCRNPARLKLMGLGVGAVAFYAAWAIFLHALIARDAEADDAKVPSALMFALHPYAMWVVMCSVAESGWYTIKGTTPSGIVLWTFWAIEAVIVLGGSYLLAGSSIDNEMFCESCDHWVAPSEMTYHEPTAELLTALPAAITPVQLLGLTPLPAKTIPSFRAELLQCPDCKRSGVRYSRLRHEKNDKGELVEKTDAIPGILLPPGQAAT
jgi:hypothetical protein